MSNGLRKRSKPEVVDFEKKAEEAKLKRVENCMAEVNAVLEKHRCDVQCVVEIGGQLVPLSAILNFPNKVQIVSK